MYRLENNGKIKDVKVINGEIIDPENDYNLLSPVERKEIEMLLF